MLYDVFVADPTAKGKSKGNKFHFDTYEEMMIHVKDLLQIPNVELKIITRHPEHKIRDPIDIINRIQKSPSVMAESFLPRQGVFNSGKTRVLDASPQVQREEALNCRVVSVRKA